VYAVLGKGTVPRNFRESGSSIVSLGINGLDACLPDVPR
jgi:hypothetical protein